MAKALGDVLKEARVALGLTLRDVERATGIPQRPSLTN